MTQRRADPPDQREAQSLVLGDSAQRQPRPHGGEPRLQRRRQRPFDQAQPAGAADGGGERERRQALQIRPDPDPRRLDHETGGDAERPGSPQRAKEKHRQRRGPGGGGQRKGALAKGVAEHGRPGHGCEHDRRHGLIDPALALKRKSQRRPERRQPQHRRRRVRLALRADQQRRGADDQHDQRAGRSDQRGEAFAQRHVDVEQERQHVGRIVRKERLGASEIGGADRRRDIALGRAPNGASAAARHDIERRRQADQREWRLDAGHQPGAHPGQPRQRRGHVSAYRARPQQRHERRAEQRGEVVALAKRLARQDDSRHDSRQRDGRPRRDAAQDRGAEAERRAGERGSRRRRPPVPRERPTRAPPRRRAGRAAMTPAG